MSEDRRVDASARFEGMASDVAAIRRFLRGSMLGADEDLVDTVVLLASEVASNVVLHARTDFEVSVKWSLDGAWVGVRDGNSRLPQTCMVPADATSGRGLHIIGALASGWGTERRPNGKLVWFEVSRAGKADGSTGLDDGIRSDETTRYNPAGADASRSYPSRSDLATDEGRTPIRLHGGVDRTTRTI